MSKARGVIIVDVGPRDGFQPIGPHIPTERKIEVIRRLHAAGLGRIKATAFVGDTAVPQLEDAAEVMRAAQALPGLDVQVAVPNQCHAERALAACAMRLAFVRSVSEKHNMTTCGAHPQRRPKNMPV